MRIARCTVRNIHLGLLRRTSPVPRYILLQFSQTPPHSTRWARHFASSSRRWQTQPQKVQLRPYQQESIQSVLEYIAKGEKRLAISLATGSGKTVIFSHLIAQVPSPTTDATQTLILAHRRELVEQAARHCQNLYSDKTVEIEMANRHASGLADITVASVQSLTRGARLMNYDPDRFKLVLVDEAHHIVASGYMDVLRHFRLADAAEYGPACLVGVSATLSRHDGMRLGAAIDHIVYHKDYLDMIEDQWLSNLLFTTVQSEAKLDNVKTQSHGDFQTGALSKAVNNDVTNSITVRAWMTKAKDRKSTLVFCVDLAHVAALTATFRAHGIDARFVTSDTPTKVRDERLEAFKNGEFPVLLNCGIYTEGTDIQNIDCIVLARPTQSRNLLMQMIGRGLRLHPDKENCHVIDMVASLETGIVSSPTLFGLDSDALLNEAQGKDLKAAKERRQKEREREDQAATATANNQLIELQGNVTFTDYDNVNDLIDDTAGERHVRQLSRNAWVQISDEKYILSNQDGSFIRIQRGDGDADADHFVVTYTRKVAGSEGTNSKILARPRNIAKASTFEDAVRAADTFVSKIFPFEFIAHSARWRRAPASSGQIDFLNKYRSKDEKLEYGSITKGRAGDRITKLRHGAKGSFNRHVARKRSAVKVQKKKAAWKERLDKSQVRVGKVIN
ncbi:putative ATP-dependent helicase IRC3 [Cercospora beticola]|uniref:Putative ATP-dependent helicase IRC3 n=1 Tax=Cercospora beticola TaxID=122368 RepID=A0A2G5I4N2_CERBT|nr:putative ATP-dependent helicase IRC3 [Cercospora beticola]PIA99462.1 putative ATP-dependent helicase IRC3 [Cercospora beticola]WPB00673.1 hypothetical protein RHO25_005293 [Cercospora beticola]CAK1361092.1 unnamed protein product [Cercospora beticola]